jgi:hypothetical protein
MVIVFWFCSACVSLCVGRSLFADTSVTFSSNSLMMPHHGMHGDAMPQALNPVHGGQSTCDQWGNMAAPPSYSNSVQGDMTAGQFGGCMPLGSACSYSHPTPPSSHGEMNTPPMQHQQQQQHPVGMHDHAALTSLTPQSVVGDTSHLSGRPQQL